MTHEFKVAWREAARVFVLSRLLIIAITVACILLLPQWIPGYFAYTGKYIYHIFKNPYANQLLFSWLRWDEKPYLNISHFGYKFIPDTAFFPLWPLLRYLLGQLLGGSFPLSFYLAGLLLANLLFYLALALLYVLISTAFDPFIARRTLLYLSFSPYGLFFFAGYSESLFLLLCVAMFVFLQRGRRLDWWLAGLCGMLATLTRSTGLLLAVPYAVVYLQRFWLVKPGKARQFLQKLLPFVPVALIPLGLAIYMAYLYFTKGNPWLFSIEETNFWGRHFTFPVATLIMSVQDFFLENSAIVQFGNLVDLMVVVGALGILALGWKYLPLPYSLFTLAMMLFYLSVPWFNQNLQPLGSQPRFILILFPLAIICALWSKRPGTHRLLIALSIFFFAVNTALFVSSVWVA